MAFVCNSQTHVWIKWTMPKLFCIAENRFLHYVNHCISGIKTLLPGGTAIVFYRTQKPKFYTLMLWNALILNATHRKVPKSNYWSTSIFFLNVWLRYVFCHLFSIQILIPSISIYLCVQIVTYFYDFILLELTLNNL